MTLEQRQRGLARKRHRVKGRDVSRVAAKIKKPMQRRVEVGKLAKATEERFNPAEETGKDGEMGWDPARGRADVELLEWGDLGRQRVLGGE